VSALPVRLEHEGAAVDAGLWVDLMVHPSHRNLTLFLDLAEANRERARADGKKIFFAFPNDRSYPVLKRMLGWSAIEEIDALEAPIEDVGGLGAEDSDAVKPIANFDAGFAELWRRLGPSSGWSPARDAAWLDWRYRARPGADYPGWQMRDRSGALKGWVITKIFDGAQVRVGDVLELCAEPEAAAALLSVALARFRSERARTVSAWATRDTEPFKLFRAWGLAPRGPRTHFAGRWTASDEAGAYPARGRDWRISKGDSDVF
jgi:hypothetical protein